MRLIILIAGLIVLPFFMLQAQLKVYIPKPGDLVRVIMDNGERYIGEYVEQGIEYLVLLTSVAEIKLNVNEVRRIKRSKYWGSDSDPHLHSTRYYIGPSTIPLKRNEAFFQTSFGLLSSIEYGITNHLSIRAGTELITFLNSNFFYFLNPRFGLALKRDVHIGVGLLLVKFPFDELAGYYYGSITFGEQNANVTFGIGDTFFNGSVRDRLLYTISAMQKIGNRFMLVSENYFIPQSFRSSILIGFQGLRYFRGKNAFELSIVLGYETIDQFVAPPLPYLGYSRKF